eukprot:747002-Rhodomonas_salina.3
MCLAAAERMSVPSFFDHAMHTLRNGTDDKPALSPVRLPGMLVLSIDFGVEDRAADYPRIMTSTSCFSLLTALPGSQNPTSEP